MEKVIIIGSGPAGLTAAIYTARAFLNPLVISGVVPGGQLIYTTIIENYPGFENGIQGIELVTSMRKQAERFGAKFIEDQVKNVDFSKKPFKITTSDKEYTTSAVIIATGARWRTLGLQNEQMFLGKGVHTCATCDGAFYKNKEVIVVGGGDSAMEESLFLSKFVKKLIVVYLNDKLNASKIMQDKAKNEAKIEYMPNSTVTGFIGNEKLEEVEILDKKTNKSNKIKIDGVFLAIGQVPNIELFKNQLKINQKGYLETINEVFTETEGVFVAGDVSDNKYRQAITAAGSGCKAALEVEKYLS